MTQVVVAVSQVKDGSMLIREDVNNPEIFNNRRKWLKQFDLDLNDIVRLGITYDRYNYCEYRDVTDLKGHVIVGDAIVTRTKGQALFLPVADCVATTLYDERQSILMLAHLGRHSLEQKGGLESVKFLVNNYGSKPEDIKIWLSPAPGKEVYPIFKLDNMGMKEAVHQQLAEAGILVENIIDDPSDTAVDDRYYSYSEYLKGNKTEDGRYAMVAVMR